MPHQQEEPYKLDLFGKENENLAVVDADFLPDGNKLYILVADDDCNLHVLQYDPEGRNLLVNPKHFAKRLSETNTVVL